MQQKHLDGMEECGCGNEGEAIPGQEPGVKCSWHLTLEEIQVQEVTRFPELTDRATAGQGFQSRSSVETPQCNEWGLGGLAMACKLIQTESFIAWRFQKTILRYKVPSRIHRAACLGNVDKVNRILAYGEEVDKRDKKNRTPLHYASTYGHSEVVALLIKKQCNIEISDKKYKTPLIKAVEHQHEECVEILLNNGANPNVQDIDGHSPLHWAIFCQTMAITETLLSHNANMELQNKDGHTPLLLALKHNKQQVAELLIQNKANIHVVDKENRTALMLAAKYEAKHVIEMLFHGGIDGLAEDHSGMRALSYALASGFNVKLILDFTREAYEDIKTRKAGKTF
ncbi:putative ankyrin repeat domain-containing protein 19 [Sciurus carolinensis]|uniref:putative ankyrin repeat domain-containing protein 19 n=1 Tax=Sciurus carolinensis TaxID=30640 RepID=UPI001FB1D0CD|nr:putative ankyrin repeat domain-containing protein 19 [Sciurus carolinensis]